MDIWSLNLRHLRATVAILDHGSISAAARAVGITQPAITQGISRLEEQIGETLFERAPDGMHATRAAELFAPRVERALSHIRSSRVTMAQMRALVALARAGSYVGASAATGLSQPSLHRAVNDLSIALRRQLVERHGKRVTLTEQGQRIARAFRLAAAELRSGLSELAGLRGQDSGRIAIGAMPLSRARILPAALARLLGERPGARADVVEGAFTELIEPLRDGELDILIGALRTPVPQGVEQHALFDDRPVVVAGAAHPLVGTRPNLDELAAYPWTVPPAGAPLRDHWDAWFANANKAPPPVPVECGSVITIREMLVASDMLTVLSPDQVRVETDAGVLVCIADVPPWFHRTIGYTTRAGWRPTAMQQAFVDHLRAVVASA